jgi:O-antigen ligase
VLLDRAEHVSLWALVASAAALQFSIAAGQILLALAIACWATTIVREHERIAVPRMFWPLIVYAALTVVSAALSPQPRISLSDCKQLVLFLIVPMTYRLFTESRAQKLISVVVSAGAVSAAYGIFQFGILHYDTLGRRPHGTLGHYMTYSGLLMLVIGVALARLLFGRRERTWAALVMPALLVAVALTSSRNAWVGACAAAAVLFLLKDFRLLAVLPVVAAIFFGVAGPALTARFVSIFDLNDPTSRDRLAMMREGREMIRDHPLVGVGPNMVEPLYPQYREAGAVEKVVQHLHNVPVQSAAERGLPALAAWLSFVVILLIDLSRLFRTGAHRFLAAAALAAVVSMLTAGMFEYNFGDSEFLMLFLILVTLPFAAASDMVSRAPQPEVATRQPRWGRESGSATRHPRWGRVLARDG